MSPLPLVARRFFAWLDKSVAYQQGVGRGAPCQASRLLLTLGLCLTGLAVHFVGDSLFQLKGWPAACQCATPAHAGEASPESDHRNGFVQPSLTTAQPPAALTVALRATGLGVCSQPLTPRTPPPKA